MGASDSSLLKTHFEGVQPVENTQNHSYTIQKAKTRVGEQSGSKRISVLIFSGDKHLMENLKHFSRTIKHPNLLYYLEEFSVDSSLTTHIVFESATPLLQCIKDLTVQELVHGMHNITGALMFIHDICLCSYNNVLMSSIFVADNGEWKLACLENMSKFTNSSWQVFAQNKIPSHLLPPEDSCEATVPSMFGYTRDVYMLGHLFKNEILNTQSHLRTSKLSIDSSIKEFVEYIGRNMLNQDYKLRPKCSSVLKHPVFNCYYSSIVNFFHNFLTKTEDEKVEFFETLKENVSSLDSRLVVTRILPLLLSDYVIYEPAAQKTISEILNPAVSIKSPKSSRGFLTETLYKDHVVPQFLKLLHSRSMDSRLLLLSHLKPILPYIPKKEISKTMLPKLLSGLRDTNDDIVSLTFHCLGDLVPYLGSNRVVGGSRKTVFVEMRPRSQTTNALVNVDSCYFAEEEENVSDSELDSSGSLTLSNFRNASRSPPKRGKRPAVMSYSSPESNNETVPKSQMKKFNKPVRKALCEMAEKLDPISEKIEDSTASVHMEEIGGANLKEEIVDRRLRGGDLLALSELETGMCEASLVTSQSAYAEINNQEYSQYFNRSSKVNLSDENEDLSSDDIVTSSLDGETNLVLDCRGGDTCSGGLLVKENRLSWSERNTVTNRKPVLSATGLPATTDGLSPRSDSEFASKTELAADEFAIGSNGWDDADWSD